MNIALICSKKDPASLNFYKILNTKFNFEKNKNNNLVYTKTNNSGNNIFLLLTKELHIYLDKKELDNLFEKTNLNFDLVIFLSKHSTQSNNKEKIVSVHAIGNWGDAKFGGVPNKVCETDPIFIRYLLQSLNLDLKKNKTKYKLKQEATHHGPYLEKPTVFLEIGSDLKAWNDLKIIEFVLLSLFKIIPNYNKIKIKNKYKWEEALGFGGSHYCTNFIKHQLNNENKYAIGHVIPNYALKGELDNNHNKLNVILKSALKKSNAQIILNEDLSIKKI